MTTQLWKDWWGVGGVLVSPRVPVATGFQGFYVFLLALWGFVLECSAVGFYSCVHVDIPRHLLESWEDCICVTCLVPEVTRTLLCIVLGPWR